MIRWHVIKAVFKRNVMSYFSGLLGYLFIIVFVVASSSFAFQDKFFTDNTPSLDHLTAVFPWMLLFIVPAITMTVWAEERRSGTDELLFTLPGTDAEIMVGKYLAVIATYTIALLFSTTQLFVLNWLSSQTDWGIVFTTYVGYWFAGCSLLAAGMLASALSRSTPVAFVLGSVMCVLPVLLGFANEESLRRLSVSENLRDFSIGLISFSSMMYFVSFAAIMLYLNYIVIAHRHWSARKGEAMGTNFVVRTACVFATFAGLTYFTGYAFQPGDFSQEKLYTLSATTAKLIDRLDAENPIEIQAFISKEVPREYIETRKTLISLLDRIEKLGGRKITVRRVEIAPFDDRADEAETLGVRPVVLQENIAGRVERIDIFLGAMIKSSTDQVVIPFFGKGLPLEYELARALGTVSREKRIKVGVLKTDAQLIQEDVSNRNQEWQLTRMLRMHYDVVAVDPDNEINLGQFDVLLAVMPSSLEPHQMPNLVDYVRSGAPIVIFDDPVPITLSRLHQSGRPMLSVAPRVPKPSPGGMMAMMGGSRQPPPPKADDGRLTSLLDVLQIAWQYDQIVWDEFNPHLELEDLGGEYLFISPQSGLRSAISDESPITSGMQELLAFHSGTIRIRENMNPNRTFTPLLRTSREAALANWDLFTESQFDFQTFNQVSVVNPLQSTDLAVFFVELSYDQESQSLLFTLWNRERDENHPVDPAHIAVIVDDPRAEDGKRQLELTPQPNKSDPQGRSSVFAVKTADLPHGGGALTGGVRFDVLAPRMLEGEYRGRFSVSNVLSLEDDQTTLVAMAQRAAHVIAAHIKEKNAVNAIFVADLDMISNTFFGIREQGGIPGLTLHFDNISFAMNAIDVLAEDETYIELRKRRPQLRTLTTLQRQRDVFINQRNAQKQLAANEAQNQLKLARRRFEEQKDQIEQDENLDERTKQRMIENLNRAEARRLEVAEANIRREETNKINRIDREMKRAIGEIERRAWLRALLLSPLPACVLGLLMMIQILVSEKRSVVPERSVK
jgi:ABC-2 type transport system permease protein